MIKKGVLIVLFSCSLLFAATTGKLSGVVKDAENGEPLPGVNVIVDGTSMGAATDLDGKYFILNIPPGDYSVRAQYMGYTTKTIKNVRINIGRTTDLDIVLEPTVLQSGEEVVVVAEREVIKQDVSYSQTALEAREVTTAPTGTDIRATIDMAASIDRDDATGNILIRGSLQDEVGLIVDDFASQDKRHGTPIFKIPRSSIEEIQILTGGFSAEYGSARSGLINVVTKEGGNKYHGTLNFRYRGAEAKHVGPNIHSRDNWWEIGRFQFKELYRGETIVNWRGEEIPTWTNEFGENVDANYDGEPDFIGWDSTYQEIMANRRLQDFKGVDKNTISPDELLEAEQWFFRPWKYQRPDQYIEATFGGPVPFTNNKLSFHLDGYYDRQSFPVKVSRDYFVDSFVRAKLRYDFTPSMTLRYRGSYGELQTVSFGYYEANLDPRNTTSSSNYFLRNSAGKNMFNFGSRSASYYKWVASNGLRFTHVVSPTTFWEVNFQYNRNSYRRRYEMDLRDLNTPAYFTKTDSTPIALSESPFGVYESFSASSIPNGTYVDPETGEEITVWNSAPEMGQHHFGYQNEDQDRSWYEAYNLKADYTSQVTDLHQIKTGLNLNFERMHLRAGNDEQFVDEWGRQSWQPAPHLGNHDYLDGGVYVEDKIEFEGMIMTLGLRGDFYKAYAPFYTDMWNYYYGTNATEFNQATGEPMPGTIYSIAQDSLEFAPNEEGPFKYAFGPRVGVSHPITENAKIFFNYGYFFQKARPDQILVDTINPYWPVLSLSNTNLEFRKNINYEFGVEHNIADVFNYRVTGYYKDVYNEIGSVNYVPLPTVYPTGDTNPYNRPENNRYRDIRGVEMEARAYFLRYFQARVNYNYMMTRTGEYGFATIYQDPFQVNELKDPDTDQPKPTPILRATLLFSTPMAEKGTALKNQLKSDWEVSAYFRWEHGDWFTYKRNSWANEFPEEDQNVHWLAYHNGIDFNVYKGLRLGGLNLRAYVNVRNLLNSKQLLRDAYRSVRDPGFNFDDYMDYLEAKDRYKPGWYDKELEDILMRSNAYYAIFQPPRSIVYGIELNF